MAKKNSKENEQKLNYKAEIRLLKEQGPGRLYFLWGPEDYLREQYLAELRRCCLPEGEDSFSFRRMEGTSLDLRELQDAVDALPFMTERSFVELRDVDLNGLKDAEEYLRLLSDIPDYCTLVFVQSTQFEPDGRLKIIKKLRELGRELHFTQQGQGPLLDWIIRRFGAAGKSIELEAAQRLMFISGELMSGLIPEIEKVAAYAKGGRVTVSDVEAVANHIPEAKIFDMTEYIAQKKYNTAMAVLSELLSDKKQEVIPMLAMLGTQMRQLYGARLALEKGLDSQYVMDCCKIRYEFVANKLMNAARGYTLPQLKRAVEICTETDFRLKSSGLDDREGMKEAGLRIAAGETGAED